MALVVISREGTRAMAARFPTRAAGMRDMLAPPIAEAGPAATPDAWHVLAGTLLLAIGGAIGVSLGDRGLYAFKPNPGISMFAVFYIFAQALERFTELVFLVVPDAGGTRSSLGRGRIAKRSAIETRDSRLAHALSVPDAHTVSDAARAQADLDRIRLNRTVLGWTFTSGLAMAGAGLLGLRLIDTISSTSNAAPMWLDLVVTGLVVGGGTKPLHDVIVRLQDARKASQDPPETGGC